MSVSQREKPKNLVLIKAKDRPFPLRYDDVLVKMKHVPRFYPKDFDKEKQPISDVQLNDTSSLLSPEIKVVDKIELNTLNEKTRPDKKSKKQLERERKERRRPF